MGSEVDLISSGYRVKIKIRAGQLVSSTGHNLLGMATTPLFWCSKCRTKKPRNQFHEAKATDRKRPVTSQCRECRSEAWHERRYPDTICAQCLKHRALDKNRICGVCNEESALRQCRGPCREILPLYLKFEEKRLVCRDCWSKLRRLRRHVSSGARARS